MNYFPYRGKSYLIAGTHNKYYCNWTNELFIKLQKFENHDKLLSDILTYRIDFFGISPILFESIKQENKTRFLAESQRYSRSFDYNIDTDFNLFEN